MFVKDFPMKKPGRFFTWYFNSGNSETGQATWTRDFFGFEVSHHEGPCNCSSCGNSWDKGKHYGLNIPPHWNGPTAWYTIKYGKGKYLRWTNSWFRWFQRPHSV